MGEINYAWNSIDVVKSSLASTFLQDQTMIIYSIIYIISASISR